jgi:hypothetical protein
VNLVKTEYENILALLGRVEAKGLAEFKEIVSIALKIEAKVANWVDADINTMHALGIEGTRAPAAIVAEVEKKL